MKARYWIPASAAVVTAGLWIAIARSGAPPDVHWAFLDGQTPLKDEIGEFGWSMTGGVVCGHGHCANEGPASLQRTKEFVYKADYKAVLAKAREEVRLKGGTEFGGIYTDAGFRKADDWYLYVSSGKYDPISGDTDEKAPYVRITVMASRKEDFFGVARRWIRGLL